MKAVVATAGERCTDTAPPHVAVEGTDSCRAVALPELPGKNKKLKIPFATFLK